MDSTLYRVNRQTMGLLPVLSNIGGLIVIFYLIFGAIVKLTEKRSLAHRYRRSLFKWASNKSNSGNHTKIRPREQSSENKTKESFAAITENGLEEQGNLAPHVI